MQTAIRSMSTLNAKAAETTRALNVDVHAATDVTGYGLVGHLGEMLRASERVGAVLHASALPVLPGALDLAREGVLAGGTKANRTHAGDAFVVADGVDDALAWAVCDAQTSGGLLIACPPEDAARLAGALVAEGLAAAVVGEVVESDRAVIRLEG